MAKTLLGISPGTTVMGLAVMRRGELIEWKVKSFREGWSNGKRDSIVSTVDKLCKYYNVDIISLKKIDPLKSSPQLDRLVEAIQRMAKQRRIKMQHYSLSDLDYGNLPKKRRDKIAMKERIADKHPELRAEYLRARNSKNEYHTKMFEAIAMVERCEED